MLEPIVSLLRSKDLSGLKSALRSISTRDKGTAFETLLAELYRGNGWLVQVQGGRGDAGADILLYHPKTPSSVSLIIQAKNHTLPLTYDQTKIELVKFEEQSALLHNCHNFRLVSVSGFVRDASKLGNFNMLLDDWVHVATLLENYDPEHRAEPKIELFAHNRSTYKRINELWEETNQVAVVQATGTGKSYLITKVLADFIDKRKIVLAPSNYILEQQQSKAPWLSDTTDYMTYAKLGWMRAEEIAVLRYDLVVLDEFHRCGAEVWGVGVQALLDTHTNAKILGTSATPVRYLDNERDMAEELFDGVVAVDLSLAEAIIRRILPVPTYISALYTLDEEISKLLAEVDSSRRTEEEKVRYREEIKNIRLDWENTSGVPEILKKHLPPGIDKLIIFCRDQQHLDEMEIEVQRWFLKAGTHSRRKTYRVLSADPESNCNLEAFKKAQGKGTVHLLFAIGMLNEGLHIPEVGAVILLRPTESPNIFYQQIGRCIEVGKDHAPVIFDLVNNFQNIRSNDLLAELEEAREVEVQRRAELGLTDDTPTIQIKELARPIEEVFEDIRNRIGSWEVMFESLCEFKERHGHCNVPDKRPDNYQLGSWLGKQRTKKSRGLLSAERTERLTKIGVIWDILISNWEKLFGDLLEFKRIHGHCNVPNRWPDNPKLRRWVFTQREFFKNGTLNEERITRLTLIGFEWDILESNWKEMYSKLQVFKENIGHCNVPRNWPENQDLSHWVSTQRSRYRNSLLSADRVERLAQIGFVWDTVQTAWEENFSSLVEFNNNYGHCNVPDKWPSNLRLSHWIGKQRSDWKNQRLSEERIKRLESIGFTWDPFDALWDQMYSILLEFKKNYGHCDVPNKWPENTKLSRWTERLRRLWTEGKLKPERINQLEDIGFAVVDHEKIKDQKWEQMFSLLCEFKNEHGHCKVPNIWPLNQQLSFWVSNQRQIRRKDRLSENCLKKLEGIGFVWHTRENLWEQNYRELLKFKDVYGNCIVPHDWPENPKLGLWVNNQRRNKKSGTLSSDRISRLDNIGFIWAIIDSAWDNNYLKLQAYYKINGHTDIPVKLATDPSFGKWVAHQRVRLKRGYLSKEQLQLLDSVKLNWNPKDTWNEMLSELVEYKKLHGDCDVQRNWLDSPKLSNWVNRQRRLYKNGQLDSVKIDSLEKICFQWDVLKNGWEQRFSELFSFKQRFGHCNVPDKWQENPKLGNWIGVQRRNSLKGKITQERVARLNEIGFVWTPADAAWDEIYSELLCFKDLTGHCNVPKRFSNNRLANWVARQRAGIKSGQINADRLRRLTNIGFR